MTRSAAARTMSPSPRWAVMTGLAVTISLAFGPASPAHAVPSQDLDFSGYSLGSLAGQNGWTQGSTAHDVALVDNAAYPASGLGAGRSVRVSNARTAKAVEVRSPSVDAVGAPSTGAAANTFDATFTITSATGALQADLATAVGISNAAESRAGGYAVFSHSAGGLQIGAQWIPYDQPAAALVNWRSGWATAPGGGAVFDAAVSHEVRMVSQFTDNDTNRLQIYVDGTLALTANNWVHYHDVAGTSATTGGNGRVDRLLIGSARSLPTATGVGYTTVTESGSDVRTGTRPALDGAGFLFTDIGFGARNTAPALPTAPPVIDPIADPAPDAVLVTPTDPVAPGAGIPVSGTGFAPFENVAFTWYPSATFAGWFQADANGVVTATVTVPATLTPGEHILQATGETSGFVASGVVAVAAAAADPDDPLVATGVDTTAALAGALVLFGLGAGLVLVARRSRVTSALR